jgi:hypothetical protein
MLMSNKDDTNIRSMLVHQCKLAARLGDEDQRREALAFMEIIRVAELPDHCEEVPV